MDYSFNVEIAKKYGVEEAVLIHNLYWWIRKNKANNQHFYKGRYWTYNSRKAFSELFPFWTERQVRRITEKLTEEKVLYVDNFNQVKYDRTLWYALSDEIILFYETGKSICPNGQMEDDENDSSICPNGQMEEPEESNGSAENVTPIPDSKPDINTDKDTNITAVKFTKS